VIQINPNYTKAHVNLGISYINLGQYQKAIESSKRAIQLNPNDADAHNNLGASYGGLGRYKEAVTEYKEALRINPNLTVAHNNLSQLKQKNLHSRTSSHSNSYDKGISLVNGKLEGAQVKVRQNPNDPEAHFALGIVYNRLEQYQNAIISYKEAIRIKPDYVELHYNLGNIYGQLGQFQDAIVSLKEAIRIKPDYAHAHNNLGIVYVRSGKYQDAFASYKEAIRINPDFTLAHNNLNDLEQKIANEKIAQERRLLEEERNKLEAFRLAEENKRQRQQPSEKQTPKSGTGSGFFVSKMGHVVTNAHVVQNCNRVTVGDNASKQVLAEIVNTDGSNDLALLKLSSLEMASAESKSLIQKLSIAVVPLASKGLLRSEDVRLGEKVMVAGYPFGDFFSNSIKVTTGVVSATRGGGDDSGQFQLDAAVQPGNSGGPIYDSGGNIVGVVISQLDKLKMAKAIGSLPENVNFGIKASTVRQFLMSSGLPSKKAELTEEKSTEQLAEIAKSQALMVMCVR